MHDVSKEQYLKMYRDMRVIRSFEFALEREFKQGKVPGMLHTDVGQEAVQTAIANTLRKTDGISCGVVSKSLVKSCPTPA